MSHSRKETLLGLIALIAFNILNVQALDNGLVRTPQMGWNTWNAFACNVSESLILDTARNLVALGLRDVGYHYVVLDDCWSDGRNVTGHLQADTTKFPNGMAHVADRLHELGLGFGMYSDAGSMTCGRYEGSLGHEEIDAQTFASWGVDYLKYDNCYNEGQSGTPLITYNRYKAMSTALNATGRPILYSMCNWGEDYPWKWAQTVANSWRISGDIFDTFDKPDARCPCSGDEGIDCALPGWHCSMMNIINKVASFADKAIPGAWNDLDLLEVGNGGMTTDEYITHFSLWAAVKSPLIISTDLRPASLKRNPITLSILTNPAVLAVSQDPLGQPAFRRWRYAVPDTNQYGQGEIQMWSGSLWGGDVLVLLVNAGTGEREMNATLEDIFWDSGPGGTAEQVRESWDVYDLWADAMDEETAREIIEAVEREEDVSSVGSEFRYDVMANGGYQSGLERNLTILLGRKVGVVEAGGRLVANVRPHGIGMFRLKRHDSSNMNVPKDEL